MNVDFDQQDIIIELPPEGKDGRSIHPAGEWSADAEYHTLDLVSYNGSSYMATRSVPAGTLPTDAEYWQVVAEKGEPGASEWGEIAGNITDQTDLQEALDSKADASDVEEGFADVAEALAGKANVGDSYTKTEENALLAGKANADDVYTKTETDTLLADKADADDVYTKTEVDDALDLKADSADVYTKTETDSLLLDKAPVILSNASGSIASFSDGSPAPVNELSVEIEPVQTGTGDPSPDNVRPISGHSTATVTRTGKNLLDAIHTPMLNGYISGSSKITGTSYDRTLYFPVKTNTTYTVSFTQIAKSTSTANDDFQLGLFSSEPAINSVGVRLVNRQRASATANYNFTYTFNSENYSWVGVKICNTQRSDLSGTLATFQLELSSTATAYEPYQGTSVTIDLDGTCYGGTLDVTTGMLTVTDVAVSKAWNSMTNVGTQDGYTKKYFSVSGLGLKGYGVGICDKLPFVLSDTYTAGAHYLINNSGTSIIVYMPESTSDNPEFTFVQPLATPLTVQLTANQMQTLLGQNNVWADTGDVAVEYRADTKRYIDSKFSQLQALILEN